MTGRTPDTAPREVVKLDAFDFHGHQAAILTDNRGHWVFPMQLSGFMGIDGNAQRQNIERNHWSEGWTCKTHVQVPGDRQVREHFLLHQRRLPMWLGSIGTSRIKNPVVRKEVERHQTEFADALADYLTKGVATNPRAVAAGSSTVTWDHAAAVARRHHGLNIDAHGLRELLTTGGILTTKNGAPHRKWEHLFWPSPSQTRWEIHASVLPQLIAFAAKIRRELALAEQDLQMSLPMPLNGLIRDQLPGGAL